MNKTKLFFLFSFISFILIGSFLVSQNSRVLADVDCSHYTESTCEEVSGCEWVKPNCVPSEGGDGVIFISCSSSNCSACLNQPNCQATNYCVWSVGNQICQAPAPGPTPSISSWCESAYCGGCNQTECAASVEVRKLLLNTLCQWENNFCGSQLMDSTKSSYSFSVSLGQRVIYSTDGTKMYGISPSYHIGDGGGHNPYLDINVFGPADYQCTAVNLDELELSPEDCPPPEVVQTKNQNGLANLFSIAKAAPPGQCWGRGIYCSVKKYPWFIKRAELYTLDTDKPDNYNRCRMRINAVDRNGDWINQGLLLPAPTSRPEPTEEENGRKRGVFNENNQNFSFQDLFKNLAANFRDLIPKSLAQILYDSVYGSLSNFQVCGYETGYWAQARAMPVNETLASAGARLEATVNGNWVDIVGWDGQVRYWGERMLMKSFSADKTIIHPEEAVTLNWEVLNAAENYPEVYLFIGDAQCAAPYNCQPNSKFFVGKEIGEKGSLTVYPNQTTNFYLIAKGASGEGLVYFISEPVYVDVLEEAVDLEVKKTTDTDYTDGPITVDEGSNIQLQWKSRDVTTCTASATPANAAWQGQVATTSSVTINNITANTIFSINCQNNEGGGSASDSVRVNISGIPTCNINVKATCDSSPYSGNASYYLNGPSSFEGNYAPYSFQDIPPGLYYLAYVYGGPGLFSGVSPFNPQYCFSGQSLEFTMNFTNCGGVSPTPIPSPGNNPPTANILCWATKDSEACLGLIDSDPQTPSVILYSHSSDPDNDITSCSWQVFNNNNQLVKEQSNCSPLIWNDELGIYRATLKVTDSMGNSDTAQKNFQIVSVNELTCDFAWDPDSPNAKQPVDFFDRSLTPAGTTLKSWSWTFEEGNPATSTLQSPQDVLFDSAGEKDVTLKATNSQNNTCTLTKPVKVKTISPKWKEVVPQ